MELSSSRDLWCQLSRGLVLGCRLPAFGVNALGPLTPGTPASQPHAGAGRTDTPFQGHAQKPGEDCRETAGEVARVRRIELKEYILPDLCSLFRAKCTPVYYCCPDSGTKMAPSLDPLPTRFVQCPKQLPAS